MKMTVIPLVVGVISHQELGKDIWTDQRKHRENLDHSNNKIILNTLKTKGDFSSIINTTC